MDFFLLFALITQAIRIALPYLAAAMGGLWSERAGVANVALEGTILVGALGSTIGVLSTGSSWVGVIVGLLSGIVLQVFHGVLVLIGRANAIVSGIALNLLAAGLTRFLLRALYHSSSNSPAITALQVSSSGSKGTWSFASRLFTDTTSGLILLSTIATFIALRYTRFGLRVQAVGELPDAASAVGIRVVSVRLWALVCTGALAGLAGVWLAFDQRQFSSGMSGGRGFIALAAIVAGGWTPSRTLVYALGFGAAEALQITLQSQKFVAHQIVQMLPYLATLLVLMFRFGRLSPPAALSK